MSIINLSGVQPHSQGVEYPFIVFGKGDAPTRYGILCPDGTEVMIRKDYPPLMAAHAAHLIAGFMSKAWHAKHRRDGAHYAG